VITQLASYGIPWWLVFAAVSFSAARVGRFRGVIAGQILIAVIVVALDVQWIQAEMRKPEWNGQPDQDIVFMFGVLFRIVLINTFLLPVNIAGLLSRGHKRRSVR
jgi:hypothetical protein